MLGIDIGENSIRVVNLRRRGSKVNMQEPLRIDFSEDEGRDPELLGGRLYEALLERNWQRQRAVMTLSMRSGSFVRRFEPGELTGMTGSYGSRSGLEIMLAAARRSLLAPADELVFDFWPSDSGHHGNMPKGPVLLGAAQKSALQYCRKLAAASSLRLHNLELRPLAAINGLLFHWRGAEESNIAVVSAEGNRASVGMFDEEGLISLYSVAAQDGKKEADSEVTELGRALVRVFNTLKLGDEKLMPERVFVAAAESADELAEFIQHRLGVSVTACHSWEATDLKCTKSDVAVAEYAGAVGAAFDGMSVSPIWFNFLHPRSEKIPKKKRVSWKPFGAALLCACVVCIGFWGTLVQQRRNRLQELEMQLVQAAPMQQKMRKARDEWKLLLPYVSREAGGRRAEYLRVFYELNRLLPNTENLYLEELTISTTTRAKTAGVSDIVIKGRARQVEAITTFIKALNSSNMFQEAEQEGKVTMRETPDTYYPASFSVKCNLRKEPVTVLP